MPEISKSIDLAQWIADNDRLVIAALKNGETEFSYDEVTMNAVQQRCIDRFGENFGQRYFGQLIATLPDRRPDLFPELKGFDVDSGEGLW